MDKFLLSYEELKFLNYFITKEGHNFAQNINNTNNIYYLDCEMVETVYGNEIISLAIGNDIEFTVLKVKPMHTVTNYLTDITGYDESSADEFDVTHDQLVEFLKNKLSESDILIGHHLYNDLILLNFYHEKIIDTCMIFHHPDGPPHFYSLKVLAKEHLKKNIQSGVHDPIEDGKTAYELIKYCIESGFIKTKWSRINEILVPTKENISDILIDALKLPTDYIYCAYCRGSRIIETNRPDSDYDIIVVCDNKCNVINGALIKYGNIDISIYDVACFETYLKNQIIWILECLYCPEEFRYKETIDFRNFAENYRSLNTELCNDALIKSIGFESSRKISSAKRHFNNKNMKQSKKHIFIATRFADYGEQLVKNNKITNLKRSNHVWDLLKSFPDICEDYNYYKSLWEPIYINTYRNFSNSILIKKKKTKNVSNLHLDILQALKEGDNAEKKFIADFPEHSDLLTKIKIQCNDFIEKVKKIYDTIISNKITSRKEFSSATIKQKISSFSTNTDRKMGRISN